MAICKHLWLQTLRVPRIQNLAGVGRCTSRGSSPALSTALSIVSLRWPRRGASGGLGRRGGRSRRHRAIRTLESRSDISPADIREDHVGRGILRLDQVRVSLGAAARACVAAVEPVHKAAGIVPDAEDEDHPAAQRLAHGG